MNKKLEILAVDDSKMNHKIISKVLSDKYEVVSVYSGQACLDRLNDNCPALILLDVTMPEMDGFETCERIKTHSEYRDLPVLFLSGRCSIDEKVKGYEVGAEDYITKPFVEEELLAKINRNIVQRNKKQSLSKKISHVTEIAKKAISLASYSDICMKFLSASLQAGEASVLTTLFFNSCRETGLSTTLRVRKSDGNHQTYFEDGVERELEVALLSQIDAKLQFIAAGRRVIVNHDDISVLVKNMPDPSNQDYNRIQNFIYSLVQALSLRLKAMVAAPSSGVGLASASGASRGEQGNHQGDSVKQSLEGAGRVYHKLMTEGGLIVEDIVKQLEEVMPQLNLDEYQEKEIFRILHNSFGRVEKLHASFVKQDHHFNEIISRL